jgi:hypothetical protein
MEHDITQQWRVLIANKRRQATVNDCDQTYRLRDLQTTKQQRNENRSREERREARSYRWNHPRMLTFDLRLPVPKHQHNKYRKA